MPTTKPDGVRVTVLKARIRIGRQASDFLGGLVQELYLGLLDEDEGSYFEKRIEQLCQQQNVKKDKMARYLKQGKAMPHPVLDSIHN